MTTVSVFADPPVDGVALPALAGSVVEPAEATKLYRAMLVDVCRAVQDSGATLLINYRSGDQLRAAAAAGEFAGDVEADLGGDLDPEDSLRTAIGDLVPNPGDIRYEVQVGETFAGRVGNTVTHLLEAEDATTVAAVEPAAAFLGRSELGAAAMKLRSSNVVLGPTSGGRVYFAGFGEPIDFEDAYAPPEIETLTERGVDADLEVDYLPSMPVIETPTDLAEAVARIRSRRAADRNVPPATAAVVEELGLVTEAAPNGLAVARADTH